MKDKFYGDKRDPVKWGGIVSLCTEKDINTVVQVAYYREDKLGKIEFDDGYSVDLPESVKKHFPRNIYDIKRLGKPANLDIRVIDEEVDTNFGDDRQGYCDKVCEKIKGIGERKVVFLDPDNGLEPNNCKAEHVKCSEVKEVWDSLKTGDILGFYQHQFRNRNWRKLHRNKLAKACKVNRSQVRMWWSDGIAKDVVFYFIER
jgi:hypothetical protein